MQTYSLPTDAAVEFEDVILGHVDCSFEKGTVVPKSEQEEAALAHLVDVVGFGSRGTSTKSTASASDHQTSTAPAPAPDSATEKE